MSKFVSLIVVIAVLFSSSVAYAGGGKHRGNGGYGPYNQNHTYNNNYDSTNRDYNFDFNAADAFNFLGGIISQFNAPRGNYGYGGYDGGYDRPSHYYPSEPSPIRYNVYYTIYHHGRFVRSGSIGFTLGGYYSEGTVASETYRRLGFDDYGVSYNDNDSYCQIDQVFTR